MCLWQAVIQFERLVCGFLRQRSGLPGGYAYPVARNHVVSITQPGISKSVVRIGGNRLLEQINALLQTFRGAPVPELSALQIEAVGLGITRPGIAQSPLLVAGKLHS